MAEEEAVHIRVTGKQLGVALMAMGTIFSSLAVAVIGFLPNNGNSAVTGADDISLRVEAIEYNLADLWRTTYAHREDQAQKFATIKAKTISNEYLIKQCMRITSE